MKKKIVPPKDRKVKKQEPTTAPAQEDVQTNNPLTEELAQKDAAFAELEEKYAALQREHEEIREKFLRLFADFDNFKKRSIKEKSDLIRTASQDTLTALLPVLDDFDRAKLNSEREGTTETMSEGVLLVYHKLFGILKNIGLEAMTTNGEVFDPEFHEAVTEIPAPVEEMRGKVVDTIEKGYKLGDKIIRYAKVVVGK